MMTLTTGSSSSPVGTGFHWSVLHVLNYGHNHNLLGAIVDPLFVGLIVLMNSTIKLSAKHPTNRTIYYVALDGTDMCNVHSIDSFVHSVSSVQLLPFFLFTNPVCFNVVCDLPSSSSSCGKVVVIGNGVRTVVELSLQQQ